MSTWNSSQTQKPVSVVWNPGRHHLVLTVLLSILLTMLVSGCGGADRAAEKIEVGQTRQEVRDALGEPDRTDEFPLPEAATFGPQEELTGKVPVGQPVEEWVYERGSEEIYLWFAGQSGEEPDQWTVIHYAVYPADAVY